MPALTVVITAFDQGDLVAEAVSSVRAQTRPADQIIVVDDGSSDPHSLEVLATLAGGVQHHVDDQLHVRVHVHRQENAGVSAARNAGIALASTEHVAVLDGDDTWHPGFLEATSALLDADPRTVAASAWLEMVGVATGVVRPRGGGVVDFLARNACPASIVLRRADWERAGGYDETMTQGFEDWDFALRLLRAEGSRVAVEPQPLLRYRTHPASANIRSMETRLDRYREIVARHREAFSTHLVEALLGLEETSMARLAAWEDLLLADDALPVGEATFGDGGMAAAVRVATHRR